jgi:hypothetical protein
MERGHTFYMPTVTIDTANYRDVHVEGTAVVLNDTDPDDNVQLRSGQKIHAVVMRNVSGSTLYAGRAVSPKEGYEHERFEATYTTACPLAGIIDDRLGSAGVRNGDMCLVIVKGPCDYCTPSASPTTAIGDLLYAKTGDEGKLTRHAKALAFTATETTDGTMGKVLKNSIGRALEAATSGETSTAKLIDVNVQV